VKYTVLFFLQFTDVVSHFDEILHQKKTLSMCVQYNPSLEEGKLFDHWFKVNEIRTGLQLDMRKI
jgi:hypothetical protein